MNKVLEECVNHQTTLSVIESKYRLFPERFPSFDLKKLTSNRFNIEFTSCAEILGFKYPYVAHT